MSSATTPVLAPSGNTAARPAPADLATTKSSASVARARPRATMRTAAVRCARRVQARQVGERTAHAADGGRSAASLGALLRAARLLGELLDLFVLRRALRPRELARDERQLVRALDAELAGDALERLPLQRLVAVSCA